MTTPKGSCPILSGQKKGNAMMAMEEIRKEDGEKYISFSRNQLFAGGVSLLFVLVFVLSRGGSGSLQCPSASVATSLEIARAKTLAAAMPLSCEPNCPLPLEERFRALKEKGITLWMPGATSLARALEETLVVKHGLHAQVLSESDNAVNLDLSTFSAADRREALRRLSEVAILFNGAGVVAIVTAASPKRSDRDDARKRHNNKGLAFLEVKVEQKKNKKDYEPPLLPDIDLPPNLPLQDCLELLMERLEKEQVIL